MMLRRLRQALGLALWLLTGSVQGALAHALPGSLLMLSEQDGQLHLTITLPVEDLALAAPSLAPLETMTGDNTIAATHLTNIMAYFAAHLILHTDIGPISLHVTSAKIQSAGNVHVGTYNELSIQMTGTLSDPMSLFPLTLTYDAIMHQVRNHRATVYWITADEQLIGLADFGFRRTGGKVQPVLLSQP